MQVDRYICIVDVGCFRESPHLLEPVKKALRPCIINNENARQPHRLNGLKLGNSLD